MVAVPEGLLMYGGASVNDSNTLLDDMWLLRGNITSADNAPSGDKCGGPLKTFFNLIMLHAVCMLLGWAVLVPIGMFSSRFFRHKDPGWFRVHKTVQLLGIMFAISGFVCAILSVRSSHFKLFHGIIGLIAMALGVTQPLNAVLRPKSVKGEPCSKQRKAWELYHMTAGRIAVVFAAVNISLGVVLQMGTRVTMILWFCYLGAVLLLFILMTVYRRTYGNVDEELKRILAEKCQCDDDADVCYIQEEDAKSDDKACYELETAESMNEEDENKIKPD